MAARPQSGPYPESYVPSDRGSREWKDYHGVQEVATNDNPKLDIVLVHGLGSKWKQTWCNSDGSTWVEDLLPGEVPPCRLLASGFNSITRIDGTLASFTDGCERFMQDLRAARQDEKRPIIFMAHSFGGLILQHGLAHHADAALRRAIKGIIFFGTPQFGDKHHCWAKLWKQMGKMIDGTTPPEIKESSATRLGNVNAQFDDWLAKQMFSHHVYRFYEGLPVYRVGFIVDKDECREPPSDEYVISADHLDMVKFNDPADFAYQIVVKKLKVLAHYKDTSAATSFSSSSVMATSQSSTAFGAPTRSGTSSSQFSHSDARDSILASNNSKSKLALALEDQGNYEKAEGLYRESIREFAEEKGETDRLTLFCKDKLAAILRDRSQFVEAAALSKEVLTARIENQGLENTATLLSAANLALIMRYQSKQQEAFSIMRNALDNNDTRPLDTIARTRIVSVLAKIFRDHGAYDAAVLLSRDVARSSMFWLGEKHPFTLNRLSDLTVAYSTSEYDHRYVIAEDLGLQVLDDLEKCLGRDHPNALRTARRVGNYQRFQGEYDGAFKRLEVTWMRQKELFGTRHPSALSTMTSFSAVSVLMGYIGDGKRALEECRVDLTEILGADHQTTRWTVEALEHLRKINLDEEARNRADIDPEIAQFFRAPSHIQNKVSLDPVPVFWSESFPQESALIEALLHRDFRAVSEVVEDIRDESLLGRGLRVAAYLGKSDVVRLLLERGAHVNAQGGYYGTPLQAAAASGHLDVVEFLLEMNADVNLQAGVLNTPLRAAVFRGHDAIADLLLNARADPNVHDECTSPLQVALARRDAPDRVTASVRKLLERGANPNAPDPLWGSPLQEASFLGSLDVMKLLLQYGADPNLPGGLYGSAMQAALRASRRDAVQLLMASGADASNYNLLNAIIESGMDLGMVSFGRHTSGDLASLSSGNGSGNASGGSGNTSYGSGYGSGGGGGASEIIEPTFAPQANISRLTFRCKTMRIRKSGDSLNNDGAAAAGANNKEEGGEGAAGAKGKGVEVEIARRKEADARAKTPPRRNRSPKDGGSPGSNKKEERKDQAKAKRSGKHLKIWGR